MVIRLCGILERQDIHVVVLVEQLLRCCCDTENLNVIIIIDQWAKSCIDESCKLVCFIKPYLKEEFPLCEGALI